MLSESEAFETHSDLLYPQLGFYSALASLQLRLSRAAITSAPYHQILVKMRQWDPLEQTFFECKFRNAPLHMACLKSAVKWLLNMEIRQTIISIFIFIKTHNLLSVWTSLIE